MRKEVKKYLVFLSIIITYLSFIELAGSETISHKDLTGADLHIPKTHQESHQKGGSDALTGNLGTITVDTFTVGANAAGYDVKFYGTTSAKYLLWDASEDKLFVNDVDISTGGEGAPGGSDTQLQYNDGGVFGGLSTFTWDDTNFNMTAPFIVGINDTGYDVKFYAAASGEYLLYDESANILYLRGGEITIGSGIDQNETVLTVDRASTDATITWDETNDEFDFNYPINVAGAGGATITGPLTVGSNADGYNVTFYGTTTGNYLLWDASGDRLTFKDADDSGSIYFDNTRNDLIFTNDGIFEDINPGLYIRCIDTGRYFGWHYHYNEAYPLAFYTLLTDGSVDGLPLISSDNTGTEINFPKGIGSKSPFNKTAYFDAEFDNGNSSTADTIDWGVGNKQKSTLTGNCTFTFIAPAGPTSLILRLVQDNVGSRTVVWPASVHWPAATAPTLTTTANQVDLVTFYYANGIYYGASSLNYTP